MADVILVKLESIDSEEDIRGFHPPFSILYLASALENEGFSLKVMHEEATEVNIKALLDLIFREKPALIGFSVLTGPQIIPSLEASKKIKEKFNIPIIWGGIQPTLLPELTLQKDFIDIIAIAEGECTLVELTQIYTQGKAKSYPLEKVAGICFKKNGQLIFTASRPFIKDLDAYRAAWHYLDIERYIKPEIYLDLKLGGGDRAIAINTSRGCPWRCGYCYNVAFNKRLFRAQSASRVIKEIKEQTKRYDLSSIRFSDDHFFSNNARALEIICHVDIPWTATIRVDDLTRGGENFVSKIAESNCAFLRCGAESGSQRILDLMQKDIRVEQIIEAAELCHKFNVCIGFFFMMGFPGETWDDILLTLDLIDELELIGENITASLPSIFCPYPGAPLLDIAIDNGFLAPSTLEAWGTTNDRIIRNTGNLPPYVDKRVDKVIEYLRIVRARDINSLFFSIVVRFFKRVARWRWKHRFFSVSIDLYLAYLGRWLLKKTGDKISRK